jgi:hypothetical protein
LEVGTSRGSGIGVPNFDTWSFHWPQRRSVQPRALNVRVPPVGCTECARRAAEVHIALVPFSSPSSLHSDSCRCAIIGVPWRLRRLSLFSTCMNTFSANKSPQAKHAATDPHHGTPAMAHFQPPDSRRAISTHHLCFASRVTRCRAKVRQKVLVRFQLG